MFDVMKGSGWAFQEVFPCSERTFLTIWRGDGNIYGQDPASIQTLLIPVSWYLFFVLTSLIPRIKETKKT